MFKKVLAISMRLELKIYDFFIVKLHKTFKMTWVNMGYFKHFNGFSDSLRNLVPDRFPFMLFHGKSSGSHVTFHVKYRENLNNG